VEAAMNHFEEEARGLKVAKLVEAMDRALRSRAAGMTADLVEAVLSDPEALCLVASALRGATDGFWQELAADACVNPPSAETRERVARVYERRAKEASE
jgi:hypothetical protein